MNREQVKRLKLSGDGRSGDVDDWWSLLPDLVLHRIAMSVVSPADFLALSGVCRAWRSVLMQQKTIDDFVSRNGTHLFLFYPGSNASSVRPRFYCLGDGRIYKTLAPLPGVDDLTFIGQSSGYLIALDSYTRTIPSLVNPVTGARCVFPVLYDARFDFAVLTAPPSAPRSVLILVQKRKKLQYCFSGRDEWKELLIGWRIFDIVIFKDQLCLSIGIGTYIFNLDILEEGGFNLDLASTKRQETPPGMLLESSNGELLAITVRSDAIVAFRMLHESEVSSDDGTENGPRSKNPMLYNWDWEKVWWEKCQTLLFTWQRSDVYCTSWPLRFGNFEFQGKASKGTICPANRFWSKYLERFPPLSNSLFVQIDCHEMAMMSNVQPPWDPPVFLKRK